MLMVGWRPPSVEVISEHAERDEDEYEALRESVGERLHHYEQRG
jgi:hypothetical protein